MPEADVGPVVYPTLKVAETAEATLGGRKVRFTAHPRGHSSCDLSLLDGGSGLAVPRRHPVRRPRSRRWTAA